MDNEKLINKFRCEISKMSQEECENKHAIYRANLELLNYASVIVGLLSWLISVSTDSLDLAIIIIIIIIIALTIPSIFYRKKKMVMIDLLEKIRLK